MAGVSGRMVFFAFSLFTSACPFHKYDKSIPYRPPIIETAVGDSMGKYDTTKKMDLSVVPRKDTSSRIDTMQVLPPTNCPELEKLEMPPRIKKQ